MRIRGRKILVLGGSGLVGMAICRELLARSPRQVQIHSLTQQEGHDAVAELAAEFGGELLTASWGNIFGSSLDMSPRDWIWSQIGTLDHETLPSFHLYQLLVESRADLVIDCVNTATVIAYSDIFQAAEKVWRLLDEGPIPPERARKLLEALYIPRLIRHIQVLFNGMAKAETAVYFKIGTTGTGGMGFNVPYTHSEEKPSKTLLSKAAVAGAHSSLLFLMARTPGAPIVKEIKPAAAIAWKRIGHGPIRRQGRPIRLVDAEPRALGDAFSSHDPAAACENGAELETVFIDTGENGVFGLEEFALLTTTDQMEFVTPEEIAQYLIIEIEGGNTGREIIAALDGAVLGPTYRAGMQRRWALDQMNELERRHHTRSIGFMMLGPPRNTKLLMEAHLLREAFGSMRAVRESTPEEVSSELDRLVREDQRLTSEVVSVGVPILLPSGELVRGVDVAHPSGAEDEEISEARLESWIENGWVDLRVANCARWIDRFAKIREEIEELPGTDTSSRFVRNQRYWDEQDLQPGKVVGWLLSVEEQGARIKR